MRAATHDNVGRPNALASPAIRAATPRFQNRIMIVGREGAAAHLRTHQGRAGDQKGERRQAWQSDQHSGSRRHGSSFARCQCQRACPQPLAGTSDREERGRYDCLLVDSKVGISFRVARWWPGKKPSHSPRWAIQRRKHLPTGWVVAVRLAESNKAVLDYLLLPTVHLAGSVIRFTEKARSRYKACRFKTENALVRSIIARATAKGRSPTASARRTL